MNAPSEPGFIIFGESEINFGESEISSLLCFNFRMTASQVQWLINGIRTFVNGKGLKIDRLIYTDPIEYNGSVIPNELKNKAKIIFVKTDEKYPEPSPELVEDILDFFKDKVHVRPQSKEE